MTDNIIDEYHFLALGFITYYSSELGVAKVDSADMLAEQRAVTMLANIMREINDRRERQ